MGEVIESASRPLRALVLEDEWAAQKYLVELINRSGLAEVLGAVAAVEEAEAILRQAAGDPAFDVIFIDVHLAGHASDEAGMELARNLRSLPKPPMCVLATASQQHALEAFGLGVVDYLLKPFDQERVTQCLRRIRTFLPVERSSTLRIVARSRRQLVFLRPEEVWAFEAADRLTFVHTTYGRFDIDLSLAAIETSFGRSLLRVHRNWLVNREYVRGIDRKDGDLALQLGPGIGDQLSTLRVPVARERAQAVRETLLADATGVRKS